MLGGELRLVLRGIDLFVLVRETLEVEFLLLLAHLWIIYLGPPLDLPLIRVVVSRAA